MGERESPRQYNTKSVNSLLLHLPPPPSNFLSSPALPTSSPPLSLWTSFHLSVLRLPAPPCLLSRPTIPPITCFSISAMKLTLAQLANHDDILTDALVDNVRPPN
jgi:hypothetical protein